jgi:type IX secretion system PorP/SprF family membrane protein
MRIILFTLVLSLSIVYVANAQNFSTPSQFWLQKQTFNPAAIAIDNNRQLSLLGTLNFDPDRVTNHLYMATFGTAIGQTKHALGLSFIGQSFAGWEKDNSQIQLNYSYRVDFSEDMKLHLGTNLSQEWITVDPFGSTFFSRLSLGAGAILEYKELQFGYSVVPLTDLVSKENELLFASVHNIYATAQVQLKEHFAIEPMAQLQFFPSYVYMNLALRGIIYEKYSAFFGLIQGGNQTDKLIFGGSLYLGNRLHLSYAYNYNIADFNNTFMPAHEIGLTYEFVKKEQQHSATSH